MTSSGGGAPQSERSSVVCAALTSVASAADECAVQRRAHAFVRLRADDDEAPDGEVGEYGLERRLLERVRIPLLDERLRGLEVLMTIWGTPGWANGGKAASRLA